MRDYCAMLDSLPEATGSEMAAPKQPSFDAPTASTVWQNDNIPPTSSASDQAATTAHKPADAIMAQRRRVPILPEPARKGTAPAAASEIAALFATQAVEDLTTKGDVVVDPAAISRTLARTAVSLGRACFGASPFPPKESEKNLAIAVSDPAQALEILSAWIASGLCAAPIHLIASDLTPSDDAVGTVETIMTHAHRILTEGGRMAFRVRLPDLVPCLQALGGEAGVHVLPDGTFRLYTSPIGPGETCTTEPPANDHLPAAPGTTPVTPTAKEPLGSYTCASLFSGAGGLDMGMERAGFRTLVAVEKDKQAAATFAANLPHVRVLQRSVVGLPANELQSPDVIVGGPPCQTFSIAGKGLGTADVRGMMLWEYERLVREAMPKSFVFENVKGIISKKHLKEFLRFITRMRADGYIVTWKVLNAAEYGAPQTRERVIVVGVRADLNATFDFDRLPKVEQWRTQRDAFHHLRDRARPRGKRGIPVSGDEFDTGGFSVQFLGSNRVRPWDKPGYTSVANGRGATLHPDAIPKEVALAAPKGRYAFNAATDTWHRRLTPREESIKQGFPEDFRFAVTSVSAAYRVVGNAVPVPLAEAVGIALKEVLSKAEVNTECPTAMAA